MSRPLVRNAAVLAASGLISRILGMAYRVVLVREVGDEALGLFQMVIPIYRIALTLATLGIPTALAQTIAARAGAGAPAQAALVRAIGAVMSLAACGAVVLGLWACAPWLSHVVLTDPRTAIAIRYLPFALIPTVFGALLRAGFEGEQRMLPGAVSQTVEGVVRVPTILLIAVPLMAGGLAYGAGGLVLGMAVGEAAALVVLLFWLRLDGVQYRRARVVESRSAQLRTARELLALAWPVMVNGLVNSAMALAGVALITRCLGAAGLAPRAATEAYGQLAGTVFPLLFMPMILVHPIAHVLVPAIADRLAGGGKRVRPLMLQALGFTLCIGCATGAAFYFWPDLWPRLIYGKSEAAWLVKPLGIAAPFIYLGYVSGNILYGMGKTGVVLRNSILSNVTRLAVIWLLVPQPRWGILGVVWAAIADSGLMLLLNVIELARLSIAGRR
ncbi:MAG TPA: oligosaccharide flippase family protein [Limnochordia bacterium]|nr:oligosaccharide flippase family protein [Limnochordia bacterium]